MADTPRPTAYGEFTEADELRIVARVLAFRGVFVKFKISFIPGHLRDAVLLDEVRLETIVGRYWNDLKRLKQWHDFEERVHRTKIAAYTLRWILALPPVNTTIPAALFFEQNEDTQQRIRDVNFWFAIAVMFFILRELDPCDFLPPHGRYERILTDLLYCMKTAAYSEKMAAILFESLTINSAPMSSCNL